MSVRKWLIVRCLVAMISVVGVGVCYAATEDGERTHNDMMDHEKIVECEAQGQDWLPEDLEQDKLLDMVSELLDIRKIIYILSCHDHENPHVQTDIVTRICAARERRLAQEKTVLR